MNKREFSKRVASEFGLKYERARAAVDATLYCMTEALAEGETIRFVNDFTIRPIEAKRLKARNIKENKQIDLPPYRRLKITPGKKLKERLEIHT